MIELLESLNTKKAVLLYICVLGLLNIMVVLLVALFYGIQNFLWQRRIEKQIQASHEDCSKSIEEAKQVIIKNMNAFLSFF